MSKRNAQAAMRQTDQHMARFAAMFSALNEGLKPQSFGYDNIYALDNKDPVMGAVGSSLTQNDDASGDRIRMGLQTLVQSAAMNDDLTPEIEFLAPSVDVSGQNGYFSFSDRSGGISTLTSFRDLERAVNGPVGLIDGVGVEVPAYCRSYGLGSDIDEDRCNDVQLEMQTRITEIMDLISLFRLQKAVTALTAIAHDNAKVWGSTANPVGDVRAAIELARTGSALRPTRAFFDRGAWSLGQSAYEVQNTAGAFAALFADPKRLAGYLGLEDAIVSNSLQKDASGTISAVLANKVLLFRNFPNATRRSTDILKTFWCADNGQRFRVHQRQITEKVWRVAVTFREVTLVTGPVAGNPVQQITASAS